MKESPILMTVFTAVLIALASVTRDHEPVKITGYVVDLVCFEDQAKRHPESALKAAAEHTKECSLMEQCMKAGYGVYADGIWYPFDSKGNELAKAILEWAPKKDHIRVTVEGIRHGGKILVESITEVE
ncbi:MAG: hypothetical protein ABI882_18815 [Acidobacteriota bacterium]